MKDFKYIVVGGGMAGGKALEAIRKKDDRESIALIAKEAHRPYERPPLSKKLLRGEAKVESVFLQDLEFYQDQRIELILGVSVEQINPKEHSLVLGDGRTLGYSKLLLATGGKAILLEMPGSDLDNVYTLRELEDSLAIRGTVEKGSNVVVMGGSFIGCEAAASLSQIGGDVTQIFPENHLLEKVLPVEASGLLEKIFDDRGIKRMSGTVAEEIQGAGKVEQVILDDGRPIQADVVVMGVGIKLNTALAGNAGLNLRGNDQAVVVNRYLQTSDKDIYAAGDIAAWPSERYDSLLRVEHWDVARRQGKIAGQNMVQRGKIYDALPYFFSDIFDLSFEVWGDLSDWERTVLRGTYSDMSFAISYFAKDRLVGILAAGRPEGERGPIQDLVTKGPSYDQVADDFADENRDLAQLIKRISDK